MAIISGALGHAAEIEVERVAKEFQNILIPEEVIGKGPGGSGSSRRYRTRRPRTLWARRKKLPGFPPPAQ